MTAATILLQTGYRARADESIESRHAEFVANMSRVGPPLGFAGVEPPSTPQIMKADDLLAHEWFLYPVRGLKLKMTYMFRHERYLNRDDSHLDDSISIEFKTSNKALNYRELLHEHFPRVIEAYRGYWARSLYSSRYDINYTDCAWNEWSGRDTTNPTYWKLRNDKSIDVDGRNNIYTLEPAMYWDAELCQRALGFGRDEVIQRLNGKVPRAEPLMDGVYVVFNDDPALSYEAFVQMNQSGKALLGLI
jgi:hypothetical protein